MFHAGLSAYVLKRIEKRDHGTTFHPYIVLRLIAILLTEFIAITRRCCLFIFIFCTSTILIQISAAAKLVCCKHTFLEITSISIYVVNVQIPCRLQLATNAIMLKAF